MQSGIDEIGTDLERLDSKGAAPQSRHETERDGRLANAAMGAGDDQCGESSHTCSARWIHRLSSAWLDEPVPEAIHIHRFSEMVRQAIDARFAFGADAGKFLGGSEIDGGAGGSNKCVAKIVAVEKAMHVSAADATGFTDSAVGNEFCFSLALNVRERMGSAFVESFTDVDLVAFEWNLRRGIVAETNCVAGNLEPAARSSPRASTVRTGRRPSRRSAQGSP